MESQHTLPRHQPGPPFSPSLNVIAVCLQSLVLLYDHEMRLVFATGSDCNRNVLALL